MYRKILVPMDGSELAECTLPHVRAIVKGLGVPEVVLLRVIEPVPAEAYFGAEDLIRRAQDKFRVDIQDYLSKLADDFKKDGIDARTVVVLGRPADGILDYAKENQVDLIIMSTHGRAGGSRWGMGSVAAKITRHAGVPVLVVPPSGCRD